MKYFTLKNNALSLFFRSRKHPHLRVLRWQPLNKKRPADLTPKVYGLYIQPARVWQETFSPRALGFWRCLLLTIKSDCDIYRQEVSYKLYYYEIAWRFLGICFTTTYTSTSTKAPLYILKTTKTTTLGWSDKLTHLHNEYYK